MKGDKPREKKTPRWVNEEVPETLDALKLYQHYIDDEYKFCKSMMKRIQLLQHECAKRIKERTPNARDRLHR